MRISLTYRNFKIYRNYIQVVIRKKLSRVYGVPPRMDGENKIAS